MTKISFFKGSTKQFLEKLPTLFDDGYFIFVVGGCESTVKLKEFISPYLKKKKITSEVRIGTPERAFEVSSNATLGKSVYPYLFKHHGFQYIENQFVPDGSPFKTSEDYQKITKKLQEDHLNTEISGLDIPMCYYQSCSVSDHGKNFYFKLDFKMVSVPHVDHGLGICSNSLSYSTDELVKVWIFYPTNDSVNTYITEIDKW
jgi:hypothetical protein